MKKNTSKNKAKKVTTKATKAPTTTKTNSISTSVYVYWVIILFFIAATFYILGRSHSVTQPKAETTSNVEITEEVLLQANDYLEKGKTDLIAGNLESAITNLTAAIEAGDNSAETYIMRGEAYMQSSNFKMAFADFDKALTLDSSNAIAYYDRALLNMRLEDYNAALNDINSALAAQVKNPSSVLQLRDLYAKRGQLNLWLKNWEGAIADYTNSLARPEGVVNPRVYAERAEAYTAIGNYTEAINDYTSAIRVISEQIQGATTTEERESLSSSAMSYFEKSAALNLNLGNVDASRSDLESAYTIAAALGDTSSMTRIQKLIEDLS